MLYAVLSAVLMLLVYLPSLWVRYVMHKYNKQLEQMPGTGGELAEHLIERFELADVEVEQTTEGADHYDPAAKMVRLSPSNFEGKSITAVAVAAHEVGHAIQFCRNETISQLRSRYIPKAMMMKKIGILLLTLLPVAGFVIKSPVAIFALIGLSIALQLFGALAYLIVLPEEWDASFNKALPILKEGDYLPEQYQPGAHKVLKAAALTYFAGALADVVNIGRWLLVLRR
ncbi:MAG: zinc metallopeptidase [Pseudomonadota bacterium]